MSKLSSSMINKSIQLFCLIISILSLNNSCDILLTIDKYIDINTVLLLPVENEDNIGAGAYFDTKIGGRMSRPMRLRKLRPCIDG